MGIQRNEIDLTGIGPHYLDWQYQQYNLNSTSASSSSVFYLPQANWLGGTSSKSEDYLVISDVKSGYIHNGEGPKVYAHPADVATGYPITINGKIVADSGVNITFYQLNREQTVYRVTYDSFYAYTIEDVLDGNGYIDVTYTELRNSISARSLIPGTCYRITDFFTCYDRPDFYMTPPNPSFSGEKNRKVNSALVSASASVKPIVVLATSQNTISTEAWQPAFPKDIIKYDITWSRTEFKGTSAKGRITERIDEYGNRTDYDHRDVEFIRYKWYNISTSIANIASINFGTGVLTCVGTSWGSPIPSPGDVILIEDNGNNQYWGVKLTVVGVNTANFTTDSNYSTATVTSIGMRAWIASGTNDFVSFSEVYLGQKAAGDFQIFKTFQWANELSLSGVTQSVMNYIGSYADGFQSSTGNRFVLSNNVFGTNCYSNTFGPDSANNTVGGTESSTPLYGYFYKNTTGSGFSNNIFSIYGSTTAEYESNSIGEDFFDNKVATLFRYNTIGTDFRNNWMRNFTNNSVGDTFYINGRIDRLFLGSHNTFGNNIFKCYSSNMVGNTIGNTYEEVDFADACQNNTFGNSWYGVTLQGNVISNTIGNDISNCVFGGAGGFDHNTLGSKYDGCVFETELGTTWNISFNTMGNYFRNVTIRSTFVSNQIGNQCDTSVFRDSAPAGALHQFNNIGNNFANNIVDTPSFESNVIGEEFSNNIIIGAFSYNVIGNAFQNNPVSGMPSDGLQKFSYNTIGNEFVDNTIAAFFDYNTIGHRFAQNVTGNYFSGNNVGDLFFKNTIDAYFQQNTIGCSFSENTIGQYFKNNKIGDYFFNNTTGMYFERNDIGDFFGNVTNYGGGALDNVISDYFQDNKIGNYFGNDGSNIDGGNLILSYFRNNKIGDNFIFNLIGDSVNSNEANFKGNNIGNDFSFNIIYDGFNNNEIGNVFLGNEIGNATTGVANFNSNDIGNFFGINIIDTEFSNNLIGHYFGNDGTGTAVYQAIGPNFINNRIKNYFGNDGSNTAGENLIGTNFTNNTIDTRGFINVISGDGFTNNHVREGAILNGLDFTAGPATHVYALYTFIIDQHLNGAGTIVYGHYFDFTGGPPSLLITDDPLN